jgi:hypothetical protein
MLPPLAHAIEAVPPSVTPLRAALIFLGCTAFLALMAVAYLANHAGTWKARAIAAETALQAIANGHDVADPAADQAHP